MYGASLPLSILAATLLVIGFPRWLVDKEVTSKAASRAWNIGLHIAIAIPFIALMSRFLVADTSYHYVWMHGGEDLPFRYRLAAVWAAREGPLLLWAALLGGLALLGREARVGENERMVRIRLALVHGMALLLLLLAAVLDPFRKTANPDWTGPGLNALLQTDLMVIHPPLIFLFYSFCIMLGATALATLLCSGDSNGDPGLGLQERLLIDARPAAIFGTLSIGLGGLWAYTVLDWGGYWAWDPVETGSILPWLAAVIILHLPLRPGKTSTAIYAAAGIAAAGLAIFATMVTRASGVWASSVHTFVTNESGSVPSDAWGRLISLTSDATAGLEVISYLLTLMMLSSILVAWMVANSIGEQLSDKAGWVLIFIPFSAFCGWLFIEEQTPLWDGVSATLVAIIGIMPLLVGMWHIRRSLLKRLSRDPVRLPLLIGAIAVAIWTGDAILGAVGVSLMLLLVTGQRLESEIGLITAGILFHLFSAWAQMAELAQAGAAMALFLIPLFINEPPASDDGRSIFTKGGQMHVVYRTPSTLVAIFLLLSWMLLLNSLDRTQLEAHELFGAPIIALLATGLMVYGWRDRVESKTIPWMVALLAGLSGILAWGFGNALPGDVEDVFAGPLSRGQVAWLILPAALITAPAMGLEVWNRGRKWWLTRTDSSGHSAKSHARKTRAALAGLGAHLVHFGLIILIIGHIFATTLVDRGDLSHRLSLPEDKAVVEGDLVLVFTGFEVLSEGEGEFDSRFDVGSGYVGAVIEVYEVGDGSDDSGTVNLGKHVATLQPGVLRFDNGFSRSEVATLTRVSGDFILIFDLSQASELGQAMIFGEIEDVDRVRVTAYDLPGSHLVWIGWSLMLLGMMLTWQSWWPKAKLASVESSRVTQNKSTSVDESKINSARLDKDYSANSATIEEE